MLPDGDVRVPKDCCPVCTKDLESDGWCFECRTYPRRSSAAQGHDIVGEGPKYESFREAARSLLDEWVPNGVKNYQAYWGAGICGVVREEDGTNRVFVETLGKEKRAFGVNWPVDLVTLRATAISLLVYCEAHDAAE